MAKKQIVTFLGSNQGLSIVGDHAYAYNNLGANTTSATVLKFTTGSSYFVGTLQINMPFDYSSGADTTGYLEANFNGSLVSLLTVGKASPDSVDSVYQDLIIPPHTEVEINISALQTSATRLCTVSLTGRIYDA